MRNLSDLVGVESIYSLQDGASKINEGIKTSISSFGGNFSKLGNSIGLTKQEKQEPTASELNKSGVGVDAKSAADTSHKVKLECSMFDAPSYDGPSALVGYMATDISYRVVEFDNSPTISESRAVVYEAITAPHMPMSFQKYKHTESTVYTIDVELTCRNSNEAFRNYIFCMNLRAWTKPFFGIKQMNADGSRGKLGAPPPVLRFTGYRGLIDVPVVITRLDIPEPNDCDWIDTGYNKIPFPTVLKIQISLTETFSADEINDFDLSQFRLNKNTNSQQTVDKPTSVPKTSGIEDPSNIVGRRAIETPDERWNYQYPGELRPWELGKPEFK